MGTSNSNEAKYYKDCVFCNYKTQKVVVEGETLVLFEDIKPMAKHHFLCIPKKHIKNINSLTKDHIPMLEQMKEMAIEYVVSKLPFPIFVKELISLFLANFIDDAIESAVSYMKSLPTNKGE